ncbi:hypothetical protein PHLCEN_2v1604 [Hermanssonia centrifuga]|uniref:Ankyrin n=1 Tax=Hermanssonia centrifuga TaxID=98765 RepID=A0A2R6RZP5_9APHY|nr:hypothetical protein PHLCEN_2v1604 [Hermanssonia centrifuga]
MAEKDATVRLRRAVKENNLFLVKRLIKRTDMRNPDPMDNRYTSLAWAAELGHEETFEFLLSAGHDDHEVSKDAENNTILIILSDSKPPPTSAYGTGPSEHEFDSATLRMARLYYDRYPEIIDWANIYGRTAVHAAALKGSEELVRIVQLLIERGCQYNVRNNEGFTPSDYAYSMNTRDILQDTARMQFENNKKARRNVFAQAAARGNEWGAVAQIPQPPPRMYNGSVRMRSGSGTSRTTATSDSGDWIDNFSTPGRNLPSSHSSTLSPSRNAIPLPHSASSTSNTSTFSIPSPQPQSSLAPSINAAQQSSLSPIASRMRERDAEAMEKYKMRQRSGSAATTSTDAPSVNGSALSSGGASAQGDDMASLNSLVGSVAPRRRLRPSASAAQLTSGPLPIPSPNALANSQDTRNRSGTSPGALNRQSSTSTTKSPASETTPLPTPTATSHSTSRPSLFKSSHSRDVAKEKEKEKDYAGPSSDYAKFPPPPAQESSERSATPAVHRRLPFNLLSHKNGDHHLLLGHKRNVSANSLASRT